MTLTFRRVVYRGDVHFDRTVLSGRLLDETGTSMIVVAGDTDSWRLTGESGGWAGLEQLPFVSAAHTLLGGVPDEIVLILARQVRLVCQFREGRKTAAFITHPGKSHLAIPFEAPELLQALTDSIHP